MTLENVLSNYLHITLKSFELNEKQIERKDEIFMSFEKLPLISGLEMDKKCNK